MSVRTNPLAVDRHRGLKAASFDLGEGPSAQRRKRMVLLVVVYLVHDLVGETGVLSIVVVLVHERHDGRDSLSAVDAVPRVVAVVIEVDRGDVELPNNGVDEPLLGAAVPDGRFTLVLREADLMNLLP